NEEHRPRQTRPGNRKRSSGIYLLSANPIIQPGPRERPRLMKTKFRNQIFRPIDLAAEIAEHRFAARQIRARASELMKTPPDTFLGHQHYPLIPLPHEREPTPRPITKPGQPFELFAEHDLQGNVDRQGVTPTRPRDDAGIARMLATGQR